MPPSIARRPGPPPARRAATLAALALLALITLLATTPGAAAGTPARNGAVTARAVANPLLGEWGVYKGGQDGAFPAWQAASGPTKELLAKVALRPRFRWYGSWMSAADAAERIRADIRQMQDGDPDVVVPIALFKLWPRGESHMHDPLPRSERARYRAWMDTVAKAIGTTRAAVILEPDMPVLLNGWRPSVRKALVRYAARVLGDLPRASVYLDAGAVDWRTVGDAVRLLLDTGIADVQGFVVGGTHYTSTAANIRYGEKVRRGLVAKGVTGKTFLVDTADNSHPFSGLWYKKAHPRGDFNNAEACRTRDQKRCVALGIPPTTDVTASRWGLPDDAREIAGAWVDAFVWEARPWLNRTKTGLDLARTLAIARTSPY